MGSCLCQCLCILRSKPDVVAEVRRDGGNMVRLQDNRLVEYFEVKDEKRMVEEFPPVFLYHGMPFTSRQYLNLRQVLDMRFRYICITVPGMGGSSNLKNRYLGDYYKDFEEVLEHLEIINFHVVGYSFGTLHAAAIASKFPERCLSVGLYAPLYPVREIRENNIAYDLFIKYSCCISPLITCFGECLPVISWFLQQQGTYTGDLDHVFLSYKLQGYSIEGFRENVKIWARPWDETKWNIGDISSNTKVVISNGDEDPMSTEEMVENYLVGIRHAIHRRYEGEGHQHFFTHMLELLSTQIEGFGKLDYRGEL